ncbi:hypothetical protein KEM48_009578 [Puccinia striiformis f. sp. tritici PST-130]|uniref:RxLR effector candidate protein n=1 Tax=Puccinia striiformis f. sp. tritici PST-78 TaxID=1165861 RepID=A0A0L0VFE4_9BASI|nr:hypothetical protein KEM48_009578 [Puccinia striiformis f. sp. tritici PST-130]KNE97958.1 hypothetical protein PSTG_08831 [Puccinia striiformis f. sp. tritici PST-78]
MAGQMCLRACLVLCVMLPMGSTMENAANDLREAELSRKTITESPDVVELAASGSEGSQLKGIPSIVNPRPLPSNKLEEIIDKAGREWQTGSSSSEAWSNGQHLPSNMFWQHIMNEAKKENFDTIRELMSAGVFDLMPRILSQRMYYKLQATSEEQKLIDSSWEDLFRKWWITGHSKAEQGDNEVRRAKRILERVDGIAGYVIYKQEEKGVKTEEEMKTIGVKYLNVIANDLIKQCWISFKSLLPGHKEKNSHVENLITMSEDIHFSLDNSPGVIKKIAIESKKKFNQDSRFKVTVLKRPH